RARRGGRRRAASPRVPRHARRVRGRTHLGGWNRRVGGSRMTTQSTQSAVNGDVAAGESPAATNAKSTRAGCALITGASRGIGAATAIALAEDGWTVGVNYNRDSAGAEQVCSAIRQAGGTALALPADVASSESTDAILDQLTEAAGPIRIL